MRITISLETHAVITQPSPARVKGGSFAPVEVAFTRGLQNVMLPPGAIIEFALKPKDRITGGTLLYHQTFDFGGGIYVGVANFGTDELMNALGLSDEPPANDVAQIECSAEVAWSIAGRRFRCSTFTVTVDAPLIDSIEAPPSTPEPPPDQPDSGLDVFSRIGSLDPRSALTGYVLTARGDGTAAWIPLPREPLKTPTVIHVTAPVAVHLLPMLHQAQGVPGVLAFDALGRLYLCYEPNRWKVFIGFDHYGDYYGTGSVYSIGAHLV